MALATEAFLALSRAYLCRADIPAQPGAPTDLSTRAHGSEPRRKRKSGKAARHPGCAVRGVSTGAR
jgi:hypothetical protein